MSKFHVHWTQPESANAAFVREGLAHSLGREEEPQEPIQGSLLNLGAPFPARDRRLRNP